MSAGGSAWTASLSPEQRARVHTILLPRKSKGLHGNSSGGGQLWLRCSPSTGTPRDVVLLLKSHNGKVIREWRIWPVPEDEAEA